MLLNLENVSVNYGTARALHSVSMNVAEGEAVVIIGANGAGKTTTLRAISGLQRAQSGSQITFNGQDITAKSPHLIAKLGIAHVPEGRQVFTNLTVLDNLAMGGYLFKGDKKVFNEEIERVLSLFPRLRERSGQLAGTLSGGEQQMLAIGRAMMTRPRLLILDEPSLGLAPVIVREVYDFLGRLHRQKGLTILLVEQVASVALRLADRGYVLERGRIALSGTCDDLKQNPQVKELYLGVGT